MDYQQYLGQTPQVDPLKAALFGAPPAEAAPVPRQPNLPPPIGELPEVGTPGGYGQFIFKLANMVRQYGQLARQNGVR